MKKVVFMIIAMLAVVLSACKEKGDELVGVWPDKEFQISLTDEDGNSILHSETDAVILSYQGRDYRLGVKKTMLGDLYAYGLITKCDHVEGGLYRPRQDVILCFAHDEWMHWRYDEIIFSLQINDQEYSVKKIGGAQGESSFSLNGERGVLVRWDEPHTSHVFNYFRIEVGQQ